MFATLLCYGEGPVASDEALVRKVVVVCTVRICLRNLRTKAVDDMTSCLHSTQNGSTIGLFRGTHNIIASRPHHNTVEDFLILGWMKRQRIICLLKPHYKKPSIFKYTTIRHSQFYCST